jgi:hypothetical protein
MRQVHEAPSLLQSPPQLMLLSSSWTLPLLNARMWPTFLLLWLLWLLPHHFTVSSSMCCRLSCSR